MKLAKKISSLRKQKGWSQEELANKMDVSRQSVSKWESNISIPDMDKIINLSIVFNVTTDYLLKEELSEEHANLDEDELELIKPKSVNSHEARNYLDMLKKQSKIFALAVVLCIFGAMSVIFFTGTAEIKVLVISEKTQSAIGLIGLFILVAAAVALFITSSNKMNQFKYLSKNVLSLEKRLKDQIKDEYKIYLKKYNNRVVFSVVVLILSVLPLIVSALYGANDYTIMLFLVMLLALASIAIFILVHATIKIDGYKTLLNKTRESKSNNYNQNEIESYESIFWIIVLAIYLGWSFYTHNWGITWIVWPIAGVLSGIIPEIIKIKNK